MEKVKLPLLIAEVSRILGCNTHFDVLKLDQPDHALAFIDTQQVRKHYKELAILVHPDKNRATGAEAAFKRLGEAYECLVNELSQRNYLQQLQANNEKKSTKQRPKYRRKRKAKSEPKSGEGDILPTRRRTPEDIWQEFQREEEEQARRQFETKGFARVYSKRTSDASTVPPEMQKEILDSGLDAKATNWTAWSRPVLKRTRMTTAPEPVHKAGAVSTSTAMSDVPVTLLCCLLCRRKFPTLEALKRHKSFSELHLANVQIKQNKSSNSP